MAAGVPATSTCPKCAAPITLQPGSGVPRCPYCGAISMGAIEAEKAVLGVLDNRLQRRQAREELVRRKEVLELNLETIDPLARRSGDPPVWMTRRGLAKAGVLYVVALLLLGGRDVGPPAGFLLGVGTTLFLVLRAVSHAGRWKLYAAARDTSERNRPTIEKLRADLRETEDLLRQLDSQR